MAGQSGDQLRAKDQKRTEKPVTLRTGASLLRPVPDGTTAEWAGPEAVTGKVVQRRSLSSPARGVAPGGSRPLRPPGRRLNCSTAVGTAKCIHASPPSPASESSRPGLRQFVDSRDERDLEGGGSMLPPIVATAITRCIRPGDLVADPMCGIGTTLIEAIHLGRDAVGV